MRRLFAALLFTCTLLPTPTVAQTDPPGAYDFLDEVRETYRQLGAYHDRGTLERTYRDGRQQSPSLAFETRAHGERLEWRVWAANDPTAERVLWRTGTENGDSHRAFAWDRLLNQVRPLASWDSELAHGFGEGSLEALVAPLLLAGSDAALEDVEGAALEGPEPCGPSGDASCWVLTLSRMGGDLETLLWVDRTRRLIHRVEASFYTLGSSKARLSLTVHHQWQDTPPDAKFAAFEPPADARRVEAWEQQAVATAERGDTEVPGVGFLDEITVALTTVDLRVVAKNGNPITGLIPQDLRVRIGKQEVPVTALDWISPSPRSERAASPTRLPERSEASAMPPPPTASPQRDSLKVLFVQADFEPTRMRGQMKLLPLVEELLDGLPPGDQVAIVTFDSHLRLWRDFTRDRKLLKQTLFDAIRPGGYPVRRTSERSHPSLADHLDFRAAKDAAETERALLVVAEALEKIPGKKDMIFLGWGLGILRSGAVHMTADYKPAVAALERADVTVNVLDVTEADWHSLEVGLKNVAEHTGGTYQRTYHFASQATHRLSRMFAGHYILTIDRSAVPGARGDLKIQLVERSGEVLYRPKSF